MIRNALFNVGHWNITYISEKTRPKSPILCNSKQHYSAATRGFTRDGDFTLIASERCNVFLYPLKRKSHIEEPGVDNTRRLDISRAQEPKSAGLNDVSEGKSPAYFWKGLTRY